MSLFPTEEDKAYQRGYKAGAKAERERVLEELELLMDEDLYFTDYSGNTISLPIEKWDKIRKSLRREVPE